MKCEVQRVKNNPRFRILKIEGNTYIIDLSQSIWKIIFPFLTWVIPNKIYKVDEGEISKLQVLGKDKSKNTIPILLTAGIGIFLGNLLTVLTDYLELGSTPVFNVALSGIVIILLFGLRSYLSNLNKQKFYNVITLDKTLQERIWINPKSLKHFMQCFFYYVFSLGISLLFFLVFIQDGNLVPLIVATTFLLTMLVANAMTVLEGSTTVKFKKGN
ncbi:DUF443 family protein [Alkalihalobacterium chitinilyticum]|uniref:DUF443 domain-containing protein n=1 Tax=Alkalihalobacterium chitinilyticum TaxID=2980103 RepID=A0ABT5VL92_9BACI|nr:DUF443 family protein [Alkalihalobacterium chitinilyticum]MDE5415228.1 DUF443 domain-containing protein [Alkalihalobacterium chitinilyticum]